jgi:hypothetical protein
MSPAEPPRLPPDPAAARRFAWLQVWRRLLTSADDPTAAPEDDQHDLPDQDRAERDRRSPTDSR